MSEYQPVGPNLYVPGRGRCAKCGFELNSISLNVGDGSVTAGNTIGEKCPNDGAPLWRVSYEDAYRELFDLSEKPFVIMAIVDRLREEEGATVAFCCDNPDFNGLPNCCVIYNGSATNWVDEDFRADTLIECLELAEARKRGAA